MNVLLQDRRENLTRSLTKFRSTKMSTKCQQERRSTDENFWCTFQSSKGNISHILHMTSAHHNALNMINIYKIKHSTYQLLILLSQNRFISDRKDWRHDIPENWVFSSFCQYLKVKISEGQNAKRRHNVIPKKYQKEA